MARMFLPLFASLAGCLVASGLGSAGPSGAAMQKVLDMLASMSVKAKKEKKDEEIAFAKFKTWCAQETATLQKKIAADGQEIATLSANIAKLGSETSDLGAFVAKLESAVAGFEADQQAATKQREKDHSEFLTDSKDYSESVDALERALATLREQDYDRPAAAASLLQFSRRKGIPEKVKTILTAFVDLNGEQGDGQPVAYEAPEANAYEFQSGGIVSVLENLEQRFRKKLGDCQKDEMNSKHAYDMVIQDLTASITNTKNEISEKVTTKTRKEGKAADHTKQLEATSVAKLASETTLGEVTTECTQKKVSFEEKQQLRAEEIEAIDKATEILSSPEAVGAADKYFSLSRAQTSAVVLVQRMEKKDSRIAGIRRRVRSFLKAESLRLHSEHLGLLVEKMEADPFAKVKKMIDSMITRLLDDANQDADHEGFCDTELGKSKITRAKLSEDISSLAAAVDEGKASILLLTKRIAELSADVAELDGAMKDASDLRASEKARNTATVKEAQDAQAAIQAAIAVLKDFYAKALDTTALIQTPAFASAGSRGALLSTSSHGVKMGSDEWNSLANPDFDGTGGYAVGVASGKVDKGHKQGMQTFGAGYRGQQDASGGVIALLEVVLSDFAALEADTSAAEASSAKSHVEFERVSAKDKATKTKQIEMDTADKAALDTRHDDNIADLKTTQDQLLAAERYYKNLVPQCIDQGMTFEERTKAREAEIASLKEALKLLNSGDVETSAL